jgi:hypothetical protein
MTLDKHYGSISVKLLLTPSVLLRACTVSMGHTHVEREGGREEERLRGRETGTHTHKERERVRERSSIEC